MLQHEFNADWYHKSMLTHLIAESFNGLHAGSVFLGCDDALGTLHGCKSVVDECDIFLVELVMVVESQWCQMS